MRSANSIISIIFSALLLPEVSTVSCRKLLLTAECHYGYSLLSVAGVHLVWSGPDVFLKHSVYLHYGHKEPWDGIISFSRGSSSAK